MHDAIMRSIIKGYESIAADPLGLAATTELEVGLLAEDGRDLLGAQVDQVAVIFEIASKTAIFSWLIDVTEVDSLATLGCSSNSFQAYFLTRSRISTEGDFSR